MTSELEARFEDLLARIDDAKDEVDSGKLGNFEKLNREIMDVCVETQNAVPETAKALQPMMGRVILKLDELAASITDFKEKIQKEKK